MPSMRTRCGGPPCTGRTHTVSPSVTWLTTAAMRAALAASGMQQARARRSLRIAGSREVVERREARGESAALCVDDTQSALRVDAADARDARARLRPGMLHGVAHGGRRGEQQFVVVA